MKALAKLKREPGLWMVHDAPIPEVGPHDVLIRIKLSTLCGTDIHIYDWDPWAQKTIPVPMIVGHEYMGVIEKVGSEVEHLRPGMRVSGEGHIVCGHCRNCRAGKRHLCRNTIGVGVHRQGSFAEFLSLPAVNVFPIPDGIPDEIAAIFDPLGNAVHTALSFDLVGEDVLITGAGPIGMMAAAIARKVGARHVVVTDVNPWRLDLAKKMGATYAMDATKEHLPAVMQKLRMKEGFDIGLEMSGKDSALRGMLATMDHGGKIAMLGIPSQDIAIDWNLVIFKGLIIKGIYGREIFETWYKMAALLQSGLDVSKVITHRFSIDAYDQAFRVMKEGTAGKVLLQW